MEHRRGGTEFGVLEASRRVFRPNMRKTRRSKHYLLHKEHARAVIRPRLEYLSLLCGVSHGRVAIRNQETRWGSCSRKGNLNFNYRIAFLPEDLCDYVIVHELCHLREFNHSDRFWRLVGEVVPDYAGRRKKLRRHSPR